MCGPDTKCIEFKSSTRNNNPLSVLAQHTINNYHQYGPKKESMDFIRNIPIRMSYQMPGAFSHPDVSKTKLYKFMAKYWRLCRTSTETRMRITFIPPKTNNQFT